jgi:hypothetical protein
MDAARPLPLTAAGTPTPYPEEVVYRLQADVDVVDGESKVEGMRKGVATLTSHRLYWADASRTTAVQWHLSQVGGVGAEEGGILFGSAKVVLHVRPLAEAVAGAGGRGGGGGGGGGGAYPSLPSSSSSSSSSSALPHVKLSFKGGGRDPFLEDLRKALQRKAWVLVDDLEIMAGLGKGAMSSSPSSSSSPGGLLPPAEKRGRSDGAHDASSSSAAAAASSAAPAATARTAVGVGAVFEQRAKVRDIGRETKNETTRSPRSHRPPTHCPLSSFVRSFLFPSSLGQRLEESRAIASTAFSDLDNLAVHARRVVALAESYSAELERTRASKQQAAAAAAAAAASSSSSSAMAVDDRGTPSPSPSPAATAADAEEGKRIGALLAQMGVVSPVTKDIAGKMYLEEVARQLAGFMRCVERDGG